MDKIKYELVISINVFQKPTFLLKQLENIKNFIISNYCVILNCNEFMFNELKKFNFSENIFIHPIPINKSRFHGSLINGIISNMKFALENFIFNQFIILSGRTLFYNQISLENLINLQKKWTSIEEYLVYQKKGFINYDVLILNGLGLLNETNKNIINENKKEKKFQLVEGWGLDAWFWPWFKNTLLANYYLNLGSGLECSYHEGLVFSFNVCINIINFLNRNTEIFYDLCNFQCCVEEFALQTISCNEVNSENLEYGFTFIGQGNVDESDYDFLKENCFVFKVNPDKYDDL